MKLEKPLVIFDLESTGNNVDTARIVEIGLIKLIPENLFNGDAQVRKSFRVNPGVEMDEEVIRIHGITNEMLKDCPPFKDIADELLQIFEGSDVAGFNIKRFDVPLLMNEFERCLITFPEDGTKFIDSEVIFKLKEERGLTAAVRFYCDEERQNAHSALDDADATYKVLLGQIQKYPDISKSIESLSKFSIAGMIDFAGKFIEIKGVPCINFGKTKGEPISDNHGLLQWMLGKDFPADTLRWARKFLNEPEITESDDEAFQ